MKFVSSSRISLLFCALLLGCVGCQSATPLPPLEPGDLLFQDLDCGPMCDAVEAVTEGVNGADFTHVGMVSRVEGPDTYVLEAVGKGVVETPLEEFLAQGGKNKTGPRVWVGRVRGLDPSVRLAAVERARKTLGRPYDEVFDLDPGRLYCSELVYHAFLDEQGRRVFDAAPMTFNAPGSTKPFPVWTQHYERLGIPIPEGEPGVNPGAMSRSARVEILYSPTEP